MAREDRVASARVGPRCKELKTKPRAQPLPQPPIERRLQVLQACKRPTVRGTIVVPHSPHTLPINP